MRRLFGILATLFVLSVCTVSSGRSQTTRTRIFHSAEVISASGVQIPFNSVANGIVELYLTISATGTVDEVQVARPLASVTEEAAHAVKSWTFAPATMRGKPIASRLKVAVVFCPAFGYGAGEILLPPVSVESEKETGGSSLPSLSPEITAAKYPNYSGAQMTGGTVVLRVLIGAEGKPGLVRVVYGQPPLVDNASLAVKDWKFAPARLNGNEVISGIVVALVFRAPADNP
jgi:outer membrane biosynthesis protein TonB